MLATRTRQEATHLRSHRIFRAFGIEVKVHSSFYLLVGILFLVTLARTGLAPALFTTALLVALFGCVLLHEFGHSLAARWFGGTVRSIVIFPLGGISQIEDFSARPFPEMVMSVVGPLVNFAIAGLLLIPVGNPFALPRSPEQAMAVRFFLQQLLWLNVLVGSFNLLPVYPMDGGRVFQAILALRLSPARATLVAATVGQVAASLMAGIGLFYNPWLAVIGLFLFFAAAAERNRVRQSRSELEG